jgi:hypothetical protein
VIRLVEWVGLVLYFFWKLRRATGRGQARSPDSPDAHTVAAPVREVDPVHSSPFGDAWTAHDERQLIRLLSDAAP